MRRAERLYGALLENALDVVSLVSAENTFLYVSPSVEGVLGYPPEELVETSGSDLLHPDDLAEYGQAVIEGMREASGPFGPVEARYRHKDGSWRHLETTLNVLLDDPEVGGIVCVSRDVTERKRLEGEVRDLNEGLEGEVARRTAQLEAALDGLGESEGRFRATFEQAAVGMAHVGVDGGWLRVNDRLCDIVEYTREELLQKTFQDITHPEDLEKDLDHLRRLLAGEIGTYSMEKRYFRKDGQIVWIDLTVSLVRGNSGEPEYLIAVIEDISRRKRAEGALREVREGERKRMARDLHDGALQDLTYALAEAQIVRILNDNPELEGRLTDEIEALRSAERRLRAAVYDLRLGDEESKPLAELLEALVEEARRMSPGCEVRLVVGDRLPEEPSGEAGVEVLRVLREALANARRHSGATKVLVDVWAENENLIAEVSDDGRGFAVGGPNGVGLKSMRERAAALGGTLGVSSEPGAGTKVRLSMPIRRLGASGQGYR